MAITWDLQIRGGRKTDEVAERIGFTTIPPYFILEKDESVLKTILPAQQVGQIDESSGGLHGSGLNFHGRAHT